MDAFETLVTGILQRRERLWTWQNYKIDLTREDKLRLGKPSHPRIDVDVVAYQPIENRVLWVECKSYLDSSGVSMNAFTPANGQHADRFKVFTDQTYRVVASAALVRQLVAERMVRPDPVIEFWLVAGRIAPMSADKLREHFMNNGWKLRDRPWIEASLRELARMAYDDDVVMMVAKLLKDFPTIVSP